MDCEQLGRTLFGALIGGVFLALIGALINCMWTPGRQAWPCTTGYDDEPGRTEGEEVMAVKVTDEDYAEEVREKLADLHVSLNRATKVGLEVELMINSVEHSVVEFEDATVTVRREY